MMHNNPLNKKEEEDNFVTATEFGKYEICLVFPADPSRNNNFTMAGLEVVTTLTDKLGQKNVLIYRSADRDEIYVLLRANMEMLGTFADKIDYKVLCDEDALIERAKVGYPPAVKPLELDSIHSKPEVADITPFRPYQYIYCKYEPDMDDLYYKHHCSNSPFNARLRIDLLRTFIESSEVQGGLGLSLRRLMAKSREEGVEQPPVVLAAFPLHNKDELDELVGNWFAFRNILPWHQPYDEIKHYFGPKIALYYKFLGHFSYWLVFPALIGLGFELVVIGTENVASPVIPFFSLLIVMWGVMMLEYWKREEAMCALRWGMVGFEQAEPNRSEFVWDVEVNLKGATEYYFSSSKRRSLVGQSAAFIMFLCACVIAATASIYIIRFQLYRTEVASGASYISSILNTIQIQIFSYIYGTMSQYLNDRENHQTDTAYEDSMIVKNFLFIFINTFSSFFFLAFFASGLPNPTDDNVNLGQCGAPTCMSALAINLGIVLGTRLTVNNAIEWLMPYINRHFRVKKEGEKSEGRMMSAAEEQYVREKYDVTSLIDDYLEIAIQFAFMTLFVSALPASVFITLIANWVEIRGDAWSLCKLSQRPFPTGAEDVGTWQAIFDLIMAASIVTNSALIVFTMQLLTEYTTFRQFWIFIGFQWVLFGAVYLVSAIIPDVPHEVELQVERSEYIQKKLIEKTPDEEDEHVNGGHDNRSSFSLEGSILDDFPPSLRAENN